MDEFLIEAYKAERGGREEATFFERKEIESSNKATFSSFKHYW